MYAAFWVCFDCGSENIWEDDACKYCMCKEPREEVVKDDEQEDTKA